jgi:ABC-type sulfate/molybdate transport systems ATPase subunit
MLPFQQSSPILEVRDLIIHRNGHPVLKVDHLGVNKGEILAVIGPNGAGKSTLLLSIARLLKPTQGQFFFQGLPISGKDDLAFRRKIALVLQDPLLLSTTVFNNVATGLRFRGVSQNEINTLVRNWLSRLGISHLEDRPSHQLSGGEAQRVSLARAFALNPLILLLDEPFRALDSPTRIGLLEDFQSLLADTGVTAVFVTHDMDEALYLGDRVAVILDGGLRQVGIPEQVFNNPADVDVAALVGVETVLSGRVTRILDGQITVDVGGFQLEAVGFARVGQEVLMLVRPEDVTLWMEGTLPVSSARNFLSGVIIRMIPHGPLIKIVVECQDKYSLKCVRVVSLITRASAHQMGLVENTNISMTFKASAVHLIPR